MNRPPDDPHNNANLLVLAAVVLLVAATVFLLLKLKQGIQEQDCYAQGRHNCAPIDTSAAQ